MKLLGALLALGGAAGFCIQRRRYGLLPVQMPANMETVEKHCCGVKSACAARLSPKFWRNP